MQSRILHFVGIVRICKSFTMHGSNNVEVIKRSFLLHSLVVLHIYWYYYRHLTLFSEEFYLKPRFTKSAVTITYFKSIEVQP
jgi:hypothetical protein